MSDQGTEEKDLGALDATVSTDDKPVDTRINDFSLARA